MNDKDYICMIIDKMSDHLNEIRAQVQAGKYEEANQYVDGIVNAAKDLEISLAGY